MKYWDAIRAMYTKSYCRPRIPQLGGRDYRVEDEWITPLVRTANARQTGRPIA